MTYQPRPMDTSGVELAPEIRALAERLAENAHDVWAERRMAEGRGARPDGDGERREDPRFVPFAELSEAEKDFDRRTALEPIRVLQALGWRFVPPEREEVPTHPDPIALARATWEEQVRPAFEEADRRAKSHQSTHILYTAFAALFGTTAVLLAIFQLWSPAARFTQTGEVAAALIALVSVALGVISLRLPGWLLYRFKAERLRSMEFRLLADRDIWSGDPARARARLDRVAAEVAVVGAPSRRRPHRWVAQTPTPPSVSAEPGPARRGRARRPPRGPLPQGAGGRSEGLLPPPLRPP